MLVYSIFLDSIQTLLNAQHCVKYLKRSLILQEMKLAGIQTLWNHINNFDVPTHCYNKCHN